MFNFKFNKKKMPIKNGTKQTASYGNRQFQENGYTFLSDTQMQIVQGRREQQQQQQANNKQSRLRKQSSNRKFLLRLNANGNI